MRRHPQCSSLLALAALLLAGPADRTRAQDQPSPGTPPAANATAGADSLARSIPKAGLRFYVEFQGLEAHGDAWAKTAAQGILADTKTGAMFRALISQIAEQALASLPGRKLTGDDTAALVQHLLQKGFVFAVLDPPPGGTAPGVLVIRDAYATEMRPTLGRFLGTTGMAAPGVKPVTKPGNRRVVLRPDSERDGWWIEQDRDLVIAGDVDRVIAALDGKADATAATDPRRVALLKPEDGLEPVGIAFAPIPPGTFPPQAADLGLNEIKQVTYRWSLEGQALRTDVVLEAPTPRKGMLGLLDTATLDLAKLPPAPEAVESVTFLAADLPKLYDQLRDLAAAGGAGTDPFDQLEATVRKSLKKDLRKDLLAKLGPQVVLYTLPTKSSGFGAAIAAINPLAGFQVPKLALLVDIKDQPAVSKTVRDLMGVANKQLATLMPAPPAGGPGGAPGGSRPGGAAAKNAVPEFKMTSSTPVTYLLNLPPQIAALTNLKLTVAVGKTHLVVAASPDLAREALALEEKAGARWKPTGAMAEAIAGLPPKAAFLQVSDPRSTQPDLLAKLPELLQQGIDAAAAQLSAAAPPPDAPPGGPGGGPGPGGPGGRTLQGVAPAGGGGPGGGRTLQGAAPAGGGGPGGGRQLQGAAPAGGGAGAPAPGAPGGPGEAPGDGTPPPPPNPGASIGQALAGFKLTIPPEATPDAKAIRDRLFPGSMAVVADAKGLRYIAREAFPNPSLGGGSLAAGLLMPAVQSARDAARRAAGLPPMAPMAGPGGFPGGPGAPPGGPGAPAGAGGGGAPAAERP